MRAWRLVCQLGIMGGLVAAAIHCGTDNGSEFGDPANTAACNTAYPGKCGVACNDDTGCADGLYCSASKVCSADCAPGVACENAGQCTVRGQCVTGEGFTPIDSGPLPDGSYVLPDGAICASTDVTLTKADPYVLFVLDQSGSMESEHFPDENPGRPTRLQALKSALVGDAGTDTNSLIYKLQGTAQVAADFYSATSSNNGKSYLSGGALVCPRFNGGKNLNDTISGGGLAFANNSYATIAAAIRAASADEDTPTGEAIQALVGLNDAGAIINNSGFAAYDAGASPKIIILVTDGQAGSCVSATTSTPAENTAQTNVGFQKTLAVVKATKAQNISTYYIYIGNALNAAQTKQIANAGQGQDPTTGDAGAFAPTSTTALVTQLNSIVSNARSCTFALDGSIDADKASTGTVLVNGQVVQYNVGWRLADPTHIELIGDSCNLIKTNPNATLSAKFPCGVVKPVIIP